jgi:hypothetical protein
MTIKYHRAVFRGPRVAQLRQQATHISQTPLILCVTLLMAGWTSDPPSSLPNATSAAAPPASVIRDVEMPSAHDQTLIMNEATKLSLACRMFRSLYGRWPIDLAEIQAKTEGINFAVFAGRAVVTPLPDDSERIEVFDGFNTRTVRAIPIDFKFTAPQLEEAKAPGYKIKIKP